MSISVLSDSFLKGHLEKVKEVVEELGELHPFILAEIGDTFYYLPIPKISEVLRPEFYIKSMCQQLRPEQYVFTALAWKYEGHKREEKTEVIVVQLVRGRKVRFVSIPIERDSSGHIIKVKLEEKFDSFCQANMQVTGPAVHLLPEFDYIK